MEIEITITCSNCGWKKFGTYDEKILNYPLAGECADCGKPYTIFSLKHHLFMQYLGKTNKLINFHIRGCAIITADGAKSIDSGLLEEYKAILEKIKEDAERRERKG
jgi:hypothetical protein